MHFHPFRGGSRRELVKRPRVVGVIEGLSIGLSARPQLRCESGRRRALRPLARRREGTDAVLPGPGALPPEDALEAAVAGASFVFDAEEGTLTCRFDADRATPDAVNALVLRLLLDAAIPILAVTQGARLESEYLRHSA